MDFSRGSEWRKWDLHIHTPKSLIQNFGGDNQAIWEQFITDLERLPPEIKVIGINDYLFIDGYKEVLKYKKEGRLENLDLILPVIELRIDKFASLGDEAWRRVNLHIIFSNEIEPEIIEAQFISAIQHSLKLSPDIEGVDFKGIATRQSLEELGKRIKEGSSVAIPASDLKVGFWNIYYEYSKVKEITEGFFKKTCLTAVGKSEWDTMRWEASAALKKTIINDSTFSFIALDMPSHYQKHVDALRRQNVRDYLLDCSDAHSFSDSVDKDRIGNSFTWLKADTTFEGLKQVATDKSRIFIGEEPPLLTRVRNNPTKYIKSLRINKIHDSELQQEWFNPLEIQLNPALIGIIGNKGNGKSAITDTIGLLGNSMNYPEFSFLNDKKFRKRKPINLSQHYEATLTWYNNATDSRILNEDPNPANVEKVKYIPQNFLEKLCNEDVSDFEKELRKVIFSHIPNQDRLEQPDLDSLIQHVTEIIEDEISLIKGELQDVNEVIISLEQKEQSEYKANLEEKQKEKQIELESHEKAKPEKINPPSDPKIIDQNKLVSDEIDQLRTKGIEVEEKISSIQKRNNELKIKYSALDKTYQLVQLFGNQLEKIREEITPILEIYKIDFKDIIKIEVNSSPIEEILRIQRSEIEQFDKDLDPDIEGSLYHQNNSINRKLTELKEKLDEPSRIYQKYIDDLKLWEIRRDQIVGTKGDIGSLNYFKFELEFLVKYLNKEIESLFEKRNRILLQLFEKKNSIISLYKKLFDPVTKFISVYGEILNSHKIQLDVDYRLSGFVEKFFDHVSLGSKGSFIGNPAGYEKLKHIVETHDLSSSSGLVSFLTEIITNLKEDTRDGLKNEKRAIPNQLKKGYSVLDLYTFLFNLDYLEPEYKLKLGDKSISELSPGERGALLMIFYLSLDREDIPLIIDQPEENLDNQSVYNILVNFIINAKNRRQIIMVTHNPNLAVVCDAEQIIRVHIDKIRGNKVECLCGSLENAQLNNAAVDILEGTYPAFDTRTAKYKVIDRKK